MPASPIRPFQAKSGLFYLVNTKGDTPVFGPYESEREALAARRIVPAHERSLQTVDQNLRPQVRAENDINPLTR